VTDEKGHFALVLPVNAVILGLPVTDVTDVWENFISWRRCRCLAKVGRLAAGWASV
jgi:hypothetical protein